MEQEAETSESGAGRPVKATGARRVPVWLYIAAGVLLVALAGTTALMLSNRGGAMVPEAEVVTLPVPTPTVDPIARETGTAFYEALPSTVLAFALDESAAAPELGAVGALEGYRLGYTDGATTLGLLAGQWATAEAATSAYTTLVESAGESAEAATSGDVEVDGTAVGTFTMATGADGAGVLTWSNGTAVLQLSGPAAALEDVYTAFPL